MQPPVLVAVASLAAMAVAPAAAAAGGGAPAPLRSGGAAFGAPLVKPDRKPVARSFAPRPSHIRSGQRAPAIRVRVRQRGVARVRARLVVLRLPGNRPVERVSLGWVKTDRSRTVRLPSKLRLRTGRYVVRLHVRDPRGRTLRRSKRYPGKAKIVVHRGKRPREPASRKPPPGALPSPAPFTGGPGVFPVAGPFDLGGEDARFGAGRPGHIHEGQDIMAAAGTPVVAAVAGTVTSTRFQSAGAGEYVVVAGADGRGYFYAHCLRRSTVVEEGVAVAAGQALCSVGATGTTSGAPHLHFEIWAGGWRVPGGKPIDPLPELRAWAGL